MSEHDPASRSQSGDAASREPHYTVEFAEHEGWWRARCNCGADLGVYPDGEDAADALMQHAYEQGVLDERNGHVPR